MVRSRRHDARRTAAIGTDFRKPVAGGTVRGCLRHRLLHTTRLMVRTQEDILALLNIPTGPKLRFCHLTVGLADE
jgi:hypothetical protein